MATWTQSKFRLRNDNGDETTATWIAALSTSASVVLNGTNTHNCRVRIEALNSGTPDGLTAYLYVSKNGGTYYGMYTTSGCGIYSSDSTYFTDGTRTTQQIGSAAFVQGAMDDVNGRCDSTLTLTSSQVTEHEYNITLDPGNLVSGDYFEFREYATTNPFSTYSVTPRITIRYLVVNNASQGMTSNEVLLAAHYTIVRKSVV